ncbi:hypothetical protein GCM10027347_45080 [Larkinella harenae]
MIQQAIQYPELIKYLKGFSNYSWIYYCDGRKILVAKSLSFFEKKLPDFFRVHKTALVNPHYILDFEAPPRHKMSGAIHLKDGVTLPVSRRRWRQIIDPIILAMMKSSTAFQAEKSEVPLPSLPPVPVIAGPVEKLISRRAEPNQHIWVVMADEMKSGLLRQLVGERWSAWKVRLFETGTGFQKALSGQKGADLPAMVILDGSDARSLVTLQSIKENPRFRFIPTLLLTASENHDLTEQGYESGANSVIIHSSDLSRFLQVLEKTFKYWLSMVSGPGFLAKTNSSLA